MTKVFVLDSEKTPLMPCNSSRAKYLLNAGKAAVYSDFPLTIILDHVVFQASQPVEFKDDPDSKTRRRKMGIKTVVFVDFENTKNIDFSLVSKDTRVFIFVGANQNSVPMDFIQSAQQIGGRLKWIKAAVNGRNALDFIIAYESAKIKNAKVVILSNDKGFNALCAHNSNISRCEQYPPGQAKKQ